MFLKSLGLCANDVLHMMSVLVCAVPPLLVVAVPPLAKLKIFFNPSLLVLGSNHGGTTKKNQTNIFSSLTVSNTDRSYLVKKSKINCFVSIAEMILFKQDICTK